MSNTWRACNIDSEVAGWDRAGHTRVLLLRIGYVSEMSERDMMS